MPIKEVIINQDLKLIGRCRCQQDANAREPFQEHTYQANVSKKQKPRRVAPLRPSSSRKAAEFSTGHPSACASALGVFASVSVSFPDCGRLWLGDHIIAVTPEPGTGPGGNRCSARKQQVEVLAELLLWAQQGGDIEDWSGHCLECVPRRKSKGGQQG